MDWGNETLGLFSRDTKHDAGGRSMMPVAYGVEDGDDAYRSEGAGFPLRIPSSVIFELGQLKKEAPG
jgi:hypothetical protein